MYWSLLFSTVAFLFLNNAGTVVCDTYQGGQPHDKPIDLDPGTFPHAIKDTANPLWLLKFYAPWCGHCKRMAPVLDQVAGKLKGKMAIGKIDCTQHKPLCNQFGVRGFPTLKYSLDGEIYDYVGGRDAAALTKFANKLAEPPIKEIKLLHEATRFSMNDADEGIVFMASDKNKDDGSKLYEIFSAVARKKQASAHFLWLLQDPREAEDGKNTAIVQRIEQGVVEPRQWDMQELTVEALEKWVTEQNVPTLIEFGPMNFPRISKMGRPIVMTVLDMENKEMVEATKKHMMDFIIRAPQPEVEKNYYGLFDGKKWSKFLEQFHVKSEDNPQFLMLDAPAQTYWRNETYTKLMDFMIACDNGTIKPLKADKTGYGNTPFFGPIIELFYKYMPYSLAPILVVVMLLIVVFVTPAKDKDDYLLKAEGTARKAEGGNDDKPEEKKPETKKDK